MHQIALVAYDRTFYWLHMRIEKIAQQNFAFYCKSMIICNVNQPEYGKLWMRLNHDKNFHLKRMCKRFLGFFKRNSIITITLWFKFEKTILTMWQCVLSGKRKSCHNYAVLMMIILIEQSLYSFALLSHAKWYICQFLRVLQDKKHKF